MKPLLTIAKDCMKDAQHSTDWTIDDYTIFGEITEMLKSIENRKVKPHLVIWQLNTFEHHEEYIFSALINFGYEFVGNIDNSDGEYIFANDDIFYDKLFRFKSNKCDYTTTLRFYNN